MSLQLNVQQQIEIRKAEIRRALPCAARLRWLVPVLASKGASVIGSGLVRLSETPDQGGSLVSGIWLSEDLEFWEFTALVSRSTGELLEVEEFLNATGSVEISQHLPGVGKSFGALAIEALLERAHG